MITPIIHKMILLIGHARDVISSSLYGCLNLLGLIWTGFHHQNWIRKIIINPITETCFNGFNVSLHSIFGVSSPSLYAEIAWAYSWTVIDMM